MHRRRCGSPEQTTAVEDPASDASKAGEDVGPTIESASSDEEVTKHSQLPVRQETGGNRIVTRGFIAAAPIGMQKQIIYEQLLPMVQAQCAEGAATVADDIMGMDNSDILDAMGNPKKLKELIAIQHAAVMEFILSFVHEGFSLEMTNK